MTQSDTKDTYDILLRCMKLSFQLVLVHCSPCHRQMAADWYKFLSDFLSLLHMSHCTQTQKTQCNHHQLLYKQPKAATSVVFIYLV